MKGKHCSSTSPAPAQLQPSTSPAMVCKHKYQPDTALLSFARLNPTQDSRVGAALLPIIVCLLTARRVMKSAVFLPSLFTIMYLSFGAGADTVSSHLLVQPCAWILVFHYRGWVSPMVEIAIFTLHTVHIFLIDNSTAVRASSCTSSADWYVSHQ